MRAFHFSAVFLLFCAFVLTLVTSVSLPYLRTLDIARTHFGELQVTIKHDPTDQLRVSLPLFSISYLLKYIYPYLIAWGMVSSYISCFQGLELIKDKGLLLL